VRHPLRDAVLDVLAFTGVVSDQLSELRGFRTRDWDYALTWLHDAGLALYLLQKLKDKNATDVLPASIMFRLEKNLDANRRRVASMAGEFESLNRKFDDAGVSYAAVKGFTLVPQFCPDASLRHQSDFDYLVSIRSLPMVQSVLEDAGYALIKYNRNEFVFLKRSAGAPPATDGQYEANAPHAVELRLAFWDSELHGVALTEPEFSVDNVIVQRWQGIAFRTLPEEDAFLLQVIHAFNHVLTGWVRLSSLYEIGFFLNQQSEDPLTWERIERRIGDNPLLREIVVVVAELSAHFFRAPLPLTSGIWASEPRPEARIWIHSYARKWAFAKNRVDQFGLFSAAKVVLFFHQQYLSGGKAKRHLLSIRLLPLGQFFRRANSIATKSSTNSGGRWRRLKVALIRLLFHITAGVRYLWEIPRWRWLNRANRHSPPSSMRNTSPTELVSAQSSRPAIRI
jgi:Uncharacterised nucleotidyltransferase